MSLITKYNVPGPRYTSYPTVPYWDSNSFSTALWEQSLVRVKTTQGTKNAYPVSLYIHLPFCESMCTFCGCTKRITKNHLVERPYIKGLLKEFRLYRQRIGAPLIIKQLHLGGGTPTFFSAENLEDLLIGLFKIADKAPDAAFSFEGHPNNTTKSHLATLYRNGFTRVCYGVQDYNPVVQKAINRIQPFENVKAATENARNVGYQSVGHDIVFGLPFQTVTHVVKTIQKTILLKPDRIAFYSYAHVPWIKGNGQRGYSEEHLPSPDEKRQQYEIGRDLLLEAGYVEIGMDHFALPTDSLYMAKQTKTLHRNFMGYTTSKTNVMIGLGVSAIGDSWYGFAQNVKSLKEYYQFLSEDQLPLLRGHILTEEDLVIRKHILNLMCRFETSWKSPELQFPELPLVLAQLEPLKEDGLLVLENNTITVTELGKSFVRNICLPFDLRLQRKKPTKPLFSMTV